MAVVVKDKAFATQVHDIFTQDTMQDKAYRIRSSSDIKMPNSPASIPTLRLFFDML